ncbi:MAG: hypothetical protein MZV64_05265 [Ignavibacteriales bacterium]|nr:hypothetical protein [Ignavibacteriales bacterium]
MPGARVHVMPARFRASAPSSSSPLIVSLAFAQKQECYLRHRRQVACMRPPNLSGKRME